MTTNQADTHRQHSDSAWLNLGFRPFFLGAGIFAVTSVVLWFLVFAIGLQLPLGELSTVHWHAHEMLFGYSMAVIAGFVLTAAKNWTGRQTAHGAALLVLFLCWCTARVALVSGMLQLAAFADIAFQTGLCLALALPIIQGKHWGHSPIVLLVVLMTVANISFYLEVFELFNNGIRIGINGGLYLIVGMILLMGRRVIPFFIERGIDESVELRNNKTVDIAVLVLYLVFAVCAVLGNHDAIARSAALLLALLCLYRQWGWYTHGIWKKPLLWSLYLSLAFLHLGFLLHSVTPLLGVSPSLAVHALAYGGVGTITLSMMSRVTLGHTGRDVQQPPAAVTPLLLLLLLGATVRVLLPLLLPEHYLVWIITSQVLWVAAFMIFCVQYSPYLLHSRIDGQAG